MISEDLIKKMFPHFNEIILSEHYEAIYPPRKLPQGAMVTRFAPSPTGFMHIGGIYTALINKKLAQQSNGVFYLRIEDTDLIRSQEEMISIINDTLTSFDLKPDEGHIKLQSSCMDKGIYGSYLQSQRKLIYHSFIIDLIKNGYAYPCFLTQDELEITRNIQLRAKLKTGCYGKWAKWRDCSSEEVMSALDNGKKFVIRLRASFDDIKSIIYNDLIKGKIKMSSNDIDAILLKSDGLPTYHFAHVVDDYLMRTTHVIRGDEWLPSVPLHLQLFDVLGFDKPEYAHLSPIEILDESSHKKTRRKLSKRKDHEANIQFYFENGFPEEAIKHYLYNLMDSSYLDTYFQNQNEFVLFFDKMQKHGALYDLEKLKNISQNVISRMSVNQIFDRAQNWAKIWDIELSRLMNKYPDLTKLALAIERKNTRPSKRFTTWKDIRPQVFFIYDELFTNNRLFIRPDNISLNIANEIICDFLIEYTSFMNKQNWLELLKKIGLKFGFAESTKQSKDNPEIYKGHYGDIATLLRIGVCGVTKSPDLYEIMNIIGENKVRQRLNEYKANFSK